MKINLSLHELAMIHVALSWYRKTHGLVLDCDSDYWVHRLKWWVAGLLWKCTTNVYINMFKLENKISKKFINARDKRLGKQRKKEVK